MSRKDFYECDRCGEETTIRRLTTNKDQEAPKGWRRIKSHYYKTGGMYGSSKMESRTYYLCDSCVSGFAEFLDYDERERMEVDSYIDVEELLEQNSKAAEL